MKVREREREGCFELVFQLHPTAGLAGTNECGCSREWRQRECVYRCCEGGEVGVGVGD